MMGTATMSDMLVKQLKGRYNNCKLSCRTYMDDLIVRSSIADIKELVKQRMANEVALNILNSPDQVLWKIGPPDPQYIGTLYQVQTYLFGEEKLNQLIKDAFQAGVESTKAQDE